jgi:hypothetical protein
MECIRHILSGSGWLKKIGFSNASGFTPYKGTLPDNIHLQLK